MYFFKKFFSCVILKLLAKKAIGLIAITVIITLAYKYLTDQDKMKHLKGRQKEFQAEMKSHRDNPEKMMSVQKEAMKVNMEYMKNIFQKLRKRKG